MSERQSAENDAPCKCQPGEREHARGSTGWCVIPPAVTEPPVSRVQDIEAAEDRAEQVSYDSWRERGL